MVSPSCWTLMVSPRAHRFHSSSASTCRRRTGTWSRVRRSQTRLSWRSRAVCASSTRARAWSYWSMSGRVRCRVCWRCSTARSAADFGGGELVASGPSPAPAGRVEAALCVGVLPPGLIGASRGGGELLTSRRGRCLDTGEVASRRGGRGRKTSPLNLSVRHCLFGDVEVAA